MVLVNVKNDKYVEFQIFLHPQLGFAIMETKSVDDPENCEIIRKQFGKAMDQGKRIVKEIRELHKIVLKGEIDLLMPLTVCMPNVTQQNLQNSLTSEQMSSCYILCKENFEDSNKFAEHWKNRIAMSTNNNLFHNCPAIKALFILLCGLRSTTEGFHTISQQHNVVQVYKALTEHKAAKEHHENEEKANKANIEIKMEEEGESQPLFCCLSR